MMKGEDERDGWAGRRAWVRLCCPLNDTQGCGPAAEESCGGGGGGSLSEQ